MHLLSQTQTYILIASGIEHVMKLDLLKPAFVINQNIFLIDNKKSFNVFKIREWIVFFRSPNLVTEGILGTFIWQVVSKGLMDDTPHIQSLKSVQTVNKTI